MTTVQVGREGDRGSRHGPDTRQTHGVVPLRPGGQPGKQSTHPRSGEPGPKAPRMKGIMIRTTGFQGRRPTRRSTVVCFCPGPQLSPRSADGGSLLCTDTAPGALKPSARLTDSSLQLYRPGAVVHRCRNKGIKKSAGYPRPQSEQKAKPERQPWRWLRATTARSFSPRPLVQGHPAQRSQVCLVSKACGDRRPACYFRGHAFCLWTP